MTRQRKLILEIVASSRSHPTAQEIFAAARREMPAISLGTVYRNLGMLVESGVLMRISRGTTLPDCFDYPREPHWHLICDLCGRVRDIPADRELIRRIEEASGEILTSSLLTARCICRRCRENDE